MTVTEAAVPTPASAKLYCRKCRRLCWHNGFQTNNTLKLKCYTCKTTRTVKGGKP
jgi:hypothetical protein